MQLTQSALSVVLICCSIRFQFTAAMSVHSFRPYGISTGSESTSSHTSPTGISSLDTNGVSTAEMQHGIGGRIENAFASAKERGEAAFVTFVTAGYPQSEGEYN